MAIICENVTLISYIADIQEILTFTYPEYVCNVLLIPEGLEIKLHGIFRCILPLEGVISDVLRDHDPALRMLFVIKTIERLETERISSYNRRS